MSGRSMAVSVIVRLKDMFSAGIGGLINRLRSLSNMGGRLKALGSSIGKFGREVGILGGALAALSFAAPLQSAAAFDSQLRDIAITAGRTGAAVELSIAEQAKRYQKLALEVGQRSRDLAAGGQLLVAAGMEQGLIDRLMPTIGRVATASKAAVEDVSKTAFALSSNLKIDDGQMELALAKLVTAGKLGRFEFNNMAKELPELTAQMQKLGITGMEAVETLGAGLQIAMKGTSDPSTAANNFKNFLSKLNSPDAQKNFAKMGVDLSGVMADATAKGINPVEAVLEKIVRLTKVPQKEIDAIMKKAKSSGKSDQDAVGEVRKRIEQVLAGSQVGQLFQDMQVLDFLAPMMANLDEYMRQKGEINRSTLKVVDDDFASRMRGLEKQLERFAEIGDQAMRRVGLAFATNLPWMTQTLEAVLAGVAWVDQNFPGAIDGFLSLAGGALLLAGGLGVLGPVFSILAAGFGIITSALGVLGGVIAAIFSPIGILVALLVGAAAIIITNWSTFAPFFTQLWDGIKQTFSGVVQFFSSLFSGDFAGMKAGFEAVMNGIATQASAAWDIIKNVFSIAITGLDNLITSNLPAGWVQVWEQVKASCSEFIGWLTAWAGTAVEAVKQGWGGLVGFFTELWAQIRAPFDAFIAYVTDGIAKIQGTIEGVKSFFGMGGSPAANPPAPGGAGAPAGPIAPDGGAKGFTPISPVGGSKGFVPTALGSQKEQTVGGRIVVEAAPGTTVKNVQSDNPAVPMVPNRGTVVGRV